MLTEEQEDGVDGITPTQRKFDSQAELATTVAAKASSPFEIYSNSSDGDSGAGSVPWEGALIICTFFIVSVLVCIFAIKCMFRKYKQSLVRRAPIGFLGENISPTQRDSLPSYENAGFQINQGQLNWELALPEYSEVTGVSQRVCVEEDPPPSYDSVEVQKHIVSSPVTIPNSVKEQRTTGVEI